MTINNIRKESEIVQAALQRSENGEKDLSLFILNKLPKALSDLIATTWEMQVCSRNCSTPTLYLDLYHP